MSNIRINGRVLNIHLARIVYRCAVCGSKLEKQEFGLVCQNNPTHRRFIHKSKLATIESKQQENIQNLSSVYEIVDGKVVIKE